MTGAAAPLNIGVIGTGYVATAVHIPFLKSAQLANVLAVADSAPGRASTVAAQHSIPVHTLDYGALLARDDIHVVDICTPPQSHSQIAIEAIEAGKHVIVEKPVALNMVEYSALSRAARQRSHAHIGVVLNLRYMPLIQSALEVLHGRRLGQIHGVSATVHTAAPTATWFSEPALFRYGVLYDYLPHVIDVALWALQARPVAVQCVSSRAAGAGFYLTANVRSPLVGDASLLIDVAWTGATSVRSVQFWGSEHDLFIDLQDQFWYLARGHITPVKRVRELVQRAGGLAKRAAGGPASIKYGAMVFHRALLHDFLIAFSAGRCPRVSLVDGLLHVEVIDAAIRSHQEGRVVALSPDPPVEP